MAIDRKRLDGWCERAILGLVLAILVFAPLAMGAVDAWAFLVVQALTIAVMLVWTLRLWLSPRPQCSGRRWAGWCWRSRFTPSRVISRRTSNMSRGWR